jgi:hypothetical protein
VIPAMSQHNPSLYLNSVSVSIFYTTTAAIELQPNAATTHASANPANHRVCSIFESTCCATTHACPPYGSADAATPQNLQYGLILVMK